MQEFLSNPAFKIYALSATIVAVHAVTLALWTGTVRVTRKVYVNAEDAKLNKAAHGAEHADVERVKRAHLNAIENSVPFFVVGLLYVLTGASKVGAEAYCFTFVGARVLHSIFYLAGRQPFRTLTFAIGVLAIFGMSAHIIRAVL